jgi:glycosyltransferase involved in cell wall biosynthesis
MNLPRITIVTPCLNSAVTLERTLDSVRTQDYPEIEHLVIDGGSTDGTVEILERAQGVRFVSEPDDGLCDALNKGIGKATGEVIGWLNADDIYLPGALRKAAAALESRPNRDWATGQCLIIDQDDQEIRRFVTAYKNFFLRRYSLSLHLVQNFVSAPSTFVRATAFDEVGLFDERYKLSMDYDLYLRLGRRGPPVVVNEPLACFRMVEGTFSMGNFEQQFVEHEAIARRHGKGHRLPVALNALTSRAIVGIYRALESRRARRAAYGER